MEDHDQYRDDQGKLRYRYNGRLVNDGGTNTSLGAPKNPFKKGDKAPPLQKADGTINDDYRLWRDAQREEPNVAAKPSAPPITMAAKALAGKLVKTAEGEKDE